MRFRALVLSVLLLGLAACGDTERPTVDNTLPTPSTGGEESTTTEASGTTDGAPPAEVTTTTRPSITTTTREPITTTTREPITTTTRPEPTTTTDAVTTTSEEETTTTEVETTTTVESTTTTAEEVAAPETSEDDDFPWWVLGVIALLVVGVIFWLVGRRKKPLDPRWRARASQLVVDLERSRDGLVAGAAPNSPVPDPQWVEVMTGSAAARTAADAVAADAPTEELRTAVVAARDATATVEYGAAAARGGAPTAGATLPTDTAALATALERLRTLLGPEPQPPAP